MDRQEAQIKFPDREKPLYTVKDYNQALERANGNSQLALQQEEERGCGFGFIYMDTVHKELNSNHALHMCLFFREMHKQGVVKARDLSLINKEMDLIRNITTSVMNAYVAHKKAIDIWPTPGIQEVEQFGSGIVEGKRRHDLPPFDFFASDFYSYHKDEKKYIKRSPERKLHAYEDRHARSQELEELLEKRGKLRAIDKPSKLDRFLGNCWAVIQTSPIWVTIIWALVILALHFFGGNLEFEEIKAPMYALEDRGSNLITVPLGILYFVFVIVPSAFYPLFELHPAVFWGGLVGLLGVGYGGWMILFGGKTKWITKKDYLRGIEAEKELEVLEKSQRIEELEEEYRLKCALWEAFADVWRKEWLAVCEEKYISLDFLE